MIEKTTAHNFDPATVEGFGFEWTKFDQTGLSSAERQRLFDAYFEVFPWDELPPSPVGFDLGCGSGRWAKSVAPRVGKLHCIDASSAALAIAKQNLAEASNCEFHHASVEAIPLEEGSMDFGYSLGVLHHIPETLSGLTSCVRTLKKGAPFLVYLYYALDNRPWWFQRLWRISNEARRRISNLPERPRYTVSQAIATTIYWPLSRTSLFLEKLGFDVDAFPLSFHRNKSFYVMRTDALDRFGTRLEQRFSRKQVETMMLGAGLRDIRFREEAPFWTAVGRKA